MKEEVKQNVEQARAIAQLIRKEMGNGQFTIEEMRRKIFKTDGKHGRKLSWKEASDQLAYLVRFGFCQSTNIGANVIGYTISFNTAYRKAVYENQALEFEKKLRGINLVLELIEEEEAEIEASKKAKVPKKKAAAAATKKAVKKTPKKANQK